MAVICGSSQAQNWDKLIKAIIAVESKGNVKARNGRCAGILQIMPIAVKQCNALQKKRHYTLSDRYNKQRSIEMFTIIQKRYNPEGNIEKAIRIWNGGPHYSIRGTNAYTRKVLKEYK